MAAPKIPRIIGVKVDNANIGEFIILRNLTKGGQLTQKLTGDDRNTVFNAAPGTEWNDGDIVQAEIRGRLAGAKRVTLKAGGADIRITASADTSTPGVSL